MKRREFLQFAGVAVTKLQQTEKIEIQKNTPKLDTDAAFCRIVAVVLMALAGVVGRHPVGEKYYQKFEDLLLGKLETPKNDNQEESSPTRQ